MKQILKALSCEGELKGYFAVAGSEKNQSLHIHILCGYF